MQCFSLKCYVLKLCLKGSVSLAAHLKAILPCDMYHVKMYMFAAVQSKNLTYRKLDHDSKCVPLNMFHCQVWSTRVPYHEPIVNWIVYMYIEVKAVYKCVSIRVLIASHGRNYDKRKWVAGLPLFPPRPKTHSVR